MAISKEIAKKVKKYEKLQQEANELFSELEKSFAEESLMGEFAVCENFGMSLGPVSGVATPTENGEYKQVTTRFEDSEWGNYYFPVEDSDEYVCVAYST